MRHLSLIIGLLWGIFGCSTAGPGSQPSHIAAVPLPLSSVVPQALPVTVQQALQDYQQGRYEQTVMLGKQFLRQSPNAAEAGFVQYLIGEAYYEQQHYKAAIVAFDTVVQKFPQDPKVPMSWLKIGVAFAMLQEWQHARFALRSVQRQFPTTPEAQWAALPPVQIVASRQRMAFTPQALPATPSADRQPAPSMLTANSAQPSPTTSTRPAMANRMLPLSSLRKQCIQFSQQLQAGESITDCSVSDVGKLGTIGNKTYYYALYCVVSSSLPVGEGAVCSPHRGLEGGATNEVGIFVQDGSAAEVRLMLEDSLLGV